LATGFCTFLADGLATTFLATAFATTFGDVFVAFAGDLATGFTLVDAAAAGFLAAGLAIVFASLALPREALTGLDLIVFPFVVAFFALALVVSLVATTFLEELAGAAFADLRAMRTFSFFQVDRYEILGSTKTHVKSVEMTGSFFDYATNFLENWPTVPNGWCVFEETLRQADLFPSARSNDVASLER
jgi:hypothetical protein